MATKKVLVPTAEPVDSSEEEVAAHLRGPAPRRRAAWRAAGLGAAAAVGAALLLLGRRHATEGVARAETAPSAAIELAAAEPGVVAGLEQLMAKDSYSDGVHLGALHTDGHAVDFEVDLELQPGAFATTQTVLASEPGDGLALKALRTVSPGQGTLRLVGSSLSGAGHGGCNVESAPVTVGTTVKVQIMRDEERCCLSVQRGLEEPEVRCGERDASTKDFQMRPGDRVVQPRALHGIAVSGYKENVASLTMSFSVSNVRYDDMVGKCDCLKDVISSIKQAVAFWAEGAKGGHVSVTLKRSAVFDQPLPKLSERQVLGLHSRFTNTVKFHAQKPSAAQQLLERIREDTIARIEAGDDAKEKEDASSRRLASASHPRPWSLVAPSGYVEALTAAAKEADPSFSGVGSDAISVQLTVLGCGEHCDADRAALLSQDFYDIVSQRLTSVVSRGLLHGASTGVLAVRDAHCPAEVTTCEQVDCPDFTMNAHPLRPCIGGTGCEEQCCRPITCAHVQCEAPLFEVHGAAKLQTCHGERDCIETCCRQTCKGVQCFGDSMCPKHNPMKIISKPSPEALQETCCYHVEPSCGKAHTPWCAACHKCMKPHSYCKAKLHSFGVWRRRLRGDDAVEEEEEEPEEASAPATVEAPAGARRLADDAEFQADLLEAYASLNATLARARGAAAAGARRLGAPSLEEVRADKSAKLLAEAIERVTQEALNKGSATGTFTPVTGEVKDEKWNSAVKTAAAKHGGKHSFVSGCGGPLGALACEYYLESIFDHNCPSYGPVSATTVAVLTDTWHAVSCGTDGLCWVWKLKTGVPITVWVPDALCDTSARAPVRAVNALHDATYILSVGQKSEDPSDGGVGYLWDWRKGFQIRKFTCDDGAFLSAAQMPMWRMQLLGCSNGFTRVMNWATGNELELPYHAKTAEDVRTDIAGRLENFLENNVDGIVRLAITKKAEALGSWVAAIREEYPEGSEFIDEVVDAKDAVFDFVHRNDMGAVTAIAYLPTGLRFVTGSDDGNMRLWDAASGTLLRIMKHGFSGRVNAVAGFPNNCNAASGGDDGVVRVWDVHSGLQVHVFEQRYGGPVRAVQVMPGGKRVVVGSDDGFVRIWKVEECELECAFFTGAHKAITSIAINPSNPLYQIVVASADGKVRVFNPLNKGYKLEMKK